MPAQSSIATVGDKLVVGQVDTSFLTATGRVTPGTAVLNGPVYIGASPQAIGVARAMHDWSTSSWIVSSCFFRSSRYCKCHWYI